MVEVNSETDFVARNAEFQSLVTGIGGAALGTDGSLDAILAATMPGSTATVDDAIKAAVATIGEKITLRRAALIAVEGGTVASYVHGAVAPGLGKIGVIVGIASEGDPEKIGQIGKQVAMHVAAANPLAIAVKDLDSAVVERERSILAEQARESGKPEEIIDKMVEGRLRKFYEEAVLLSQAFVVDTEKTVEKALQDAGADVGGSVSITEFVAFRLGEGVEKQATDFAAEVAAAAGTDKD
jgi:elongation factor Ts